MRLATLLLGTALLATPCQAIGDPPAGEPDPSFGSFDNLIPGLQLEGFFDGGNYHDRALAGSKDATGRFVLAGYAQTDDGFCLALMRFMPDGKLDTQAFGTKTSNGTSGKICHPESFLDQDIHDLDVAIAADGSLLAAGVTETGTHFVCRFDAAGQKVTAFSGGCRIIQESIPFAFVRVLPSNDSVFVVSHENSGMTPRPVLFRLDKVTGEVQPFGQQYSIPMLNVGNIAIWARDAILVDDAIILAGEMGSAFPSSGYIARFDLKTNTQDMGFSGDGILSLAIGSNGNYQSSLSLLPGGNILSGGAAYFEDGPRFVIVEIDVSTGSFSPTFNGGSPKIVSPCQGGDACEIGNVAAITGTETHVGIAAYGEGNGFVTSFSRSGKVDMEFGTQGLGVYPFLYNISGLFAQGDRFIVSGSGDSGNGDADFALMRLSDGRVFNDEFEATQP